MHWDNAAKGAGPRVHRVLTASHKPADHRADPICPDHQICLRKATVGELEADGVAVIDKIGQTMPEMQPDAAERVAENVLQVSAVNTMKGGAKALLILKVIAYRIGRDPVTVPPVAIKLSVRWRRR